jgi:hypothetical protein
MAVVCAPSRCAPGQQSQAVSKFLAVLWAIANPETIQDLIRERVAFPLLRRELESGARSGKLQVADLAGRLRQITTRIESNPVFTRDSKDAGYKASLLALITKLSRCG